MKKTIFIIAILLLILSGYVFSVYEHSLYRRDAMARVYAIASGWIDLSLKTEGTFERVIRAGKTTDQDRKLAKTIAAQRAALRQEFLDLKTALRYENKEQLPSWLLEEAVWQNLDKIFSPDEDRRRYAKLYRNTKGQ